MSFVSLDLVLNAHYLFVSPPIQSSPQGLNLLDPHLMRDVGCIVCVDRLISTNRQKMLQSSYLVRVGHLFVHDKLDLGGRLTMLVNLAIYIFHTTIL